MSTTTIPFLPYRLFFLYIDPLFGLAGFYYAFFHPLSYIHDLAFPLTGPAPPTAVLLTQTTTVLFQLANWYFLFAVIEHCVLGSTNNTRTWRTLLAGLLLADLGRLYTIAPAGSGVFWRVWEWNAMAWGSVGSAYVGASMRIAFLAGLGLRGEETVKGSTKKAQ